MESDTEIGLRRPELDQRVAAAGGAKLPGDLPTEPHFSALLDECTALLGHIQFIETHDGLTAETTVGKNSRITYDPAFSAGRAYTDDSPWRTAALLHEIMHVSTYEQYVKPTDPQTLPHWLHTTFDYSDEPGCQLKDQVAVVEANLTSLHKRALADKELDVALRAHVAWRFEYAFVTSLSHYDTVLLDLLVYLRLKGYTHKNPFYAYVTQLSEEARERRISPGDKAVMTIP
ncbi:hypothetical protein OHS59_43855 [Streptomyces sp. NBC_00414]|uniref:hypothetical protein n=1 Tax=Streptomyces sp. NBC_00414 TaxID=2975739 RepID=UPI002E22847A